MKRYRRVLNLALAFLIALSSLGPGAARVFADPGDDEQWTDLDHNDRGRGNDDRGRGRGNVDRGPGRGFGQFAVNGDLTSVSCNTQFSLDPRGSQGELTLSILAGITLFRYPGGEAASCDDLRVGTRIHVLAWRTSEQATALIVQLPKPRDRFQHALGVITSLSGNRIVLNTGLSADMSHSPTILPEGYTPTVGDRVLMLVQNGAVLLLVKLGGVSPPVSGAGQVHFSSASYNQNENGGSATITIQRSGGSTGSVAVNVATSNGTATAGSDYTALSQTVTFASGETSKTVAVAILQDTLAEGNETVNLTLSSPTGGATLGSPSTATLTIVDDDGAANEPD